MRDKIVIDTNIFIDAWFDNDYACQEIMQPIYDRRILLLFSQETIGELIYITKNFARHTFHSEEYRNYFSFAFNGYFLSFSFHQYNE
ncbi:PIN domain-containing protein [Gracilibacillus timonensis]|uniref:PIN domain-containing protein n=1 Tax=Gracilibacillus timonensis TaxID=1816696 RepID=UPI000826CB53|nr:PIN domain-containing protein [Gracilibacillus timonensis]